MTEFHCKCCDYTTERKGNYETHLKSARHMKKENGFGNKRENHAEMNKRLLEYIKASEVCKEEEILKTRKKDLDLINELRETIKSYSDQCKTLTQMNKQKDDNIISLTKRLERYNVIV